MLFFILIFVTFIVTYNLCRSKNVKVFFEPYTLFSIFHFGYFIFRPCIILFHEGNSYFPSLSGSYESTNIYYSSLFGILFFVATSIVYKFTLKLNLTSFSFWYLPRFSKDANINILYAINVSLILLFIYSYYSYLKDYGNVGSLMLALRTGEIEGAYTLKILPQFIALLASFCFYISLVKCKSRLASFIVLFTSLLCVALTGDRSGIIVPICLVYIARIYTRKKINYLSLFLFISFAIVSLHILNELRSMILFESAVRQNSLPDWSYVLTKALNLQAFDYFLVINQYVELETLKLGEDFKNGIIGMVPRSLWPAKPEIINDGVWFSNTFFGSIKIGRPFTLLGVWYLNFHIVGFLVGATLSAVIMSTTSKYIVSSNNPTSLFFASLVTLIFATSGWTPSLPINYIKFILPMIIVFKLVSIRFK